MYFQPPGVPHGGMYPSGAQGSFGGREPPAAPDYAYAGPAAGSAAAGGGGGGNAGGRGRGGRGGSSRGKDRVFISQLLQKLRAPGLRAEGVIALAGELVSHGALRAGNERAATTLLAALGRIGKWEYAVALLRQMERPNRFSYNAAVSACAKGRQCDHALALLGEMHARGLKPDVISYSAVISACEKASMWQRALELLLEMETRGLEPDVISYSAAISACEKGAQWERALELLQAMRARGLEPNVIRCAARRDARWGDGTGSGREKRLESALDPLLTI